MHEIVATSFRARIRKKAVSGILERFDHLHTALQATFISCYPYAKALTSGTLVRLCLFHIFPPPGTAATAMLPSKAIPHLMIGSGIIPLPFQEV